MKLDVAEGLWSRIKKKWLFQACFFLNSNALICIACYRFYAISVTVKRKEKKNETTKRRTTYRFHSHSCLLIANNEIFLFASQSFVRQCSLFHRSRNLCSMHVLRRKTWYNCCRAVLISCVYPRPPFSIWLFVPRSRSMQQLLFSHLRLLLPQLAWILSIFKTNFIG